MIIQVAAMSSNRAIGLANSLPWHLPEDLQFFKSVTLGRACIHGRKTFESLKKPLPQRLNVVITRHPLQMSESYKTMIDASNKSLDSYRGGQLAPEKKPTLLLFVSTLEEAFQSCETYANIFGPDIYICGGAEIYKQALPKTNRIYLTEIQREFAGDAFFPEFNKAEFELSNRKERVQGDLHYAFCTYDRK